MHTRFSRMLICVPIFCVVVTSSSAQIARKRLDQQVSNPAADIYVCRAKDGKISYPDSPCPTGATDLTGNDRSRKASGAKSQGQDPYLTRRFDLNSIEQSLPQNFLGHYPVGIADALEKVTVVYKREFETTEQFEYRREASADGQLFGDVRVGSPMVVTTKMNRGYGSVSYSYDADSKRAIISLQLNETTPNGIGGRVTLEENVTPRARLLELMKDRSKLRTLELSSTLTHSKKYSARNALGATQVVEQLRYERLFLSFDRLPFDVNQSIELTPERAQSLLPTAKALFEIRLIAPYLDFNFNDKKPTFDSPTDVTWSDRFLRAEVTKLWLFSPDSGEVIAKFERLSPTNR